MAESQHRGRASLRLSRRHRDEAHLGRRGQERLAARSDCRQRRGLSRDSRHRGGCQGGQVRLIISDACVGLSESAAEFFPDAAWQRCVVHFYRNIFSHVPRPKMREVAAMLKAIHASEDIVSAREKAFRVGAKLRDMRLTRAAELVERGIEETLAYYQFPEEHWRRVRTNNPLERILREIRRRTRVVGAFPDGQSALNLAAARLRHVASSEWSTKKYLSMEFLKD